MYLLNINVRVYPDLTGRYTEVPGLAGEHGVVLPLVLYFNDVSAHYSLAMLTKIREAFALFWLYSAANSPSDTFGSEFGSHTKPSQHFTNFRNAVIHGTFNTDTGADPSGLAWLPSSVAKANRVVKQLTDFFAWADKHGAHNAQRFNPEVAVGGYDLLLLRAAYEFKRSKAFLGNTWARPEEVQFTGRAVRQVRELKAAPKEPPRFPDIHFLRLLKEGFTTQDASSLRDVLITILLNKGGLRESEPMHLWVVDVTQDPSTKGALVVVKHPSQGVAPMGRGGTRYSNRQDYLARVHNLRPRDLQPGPLHAGWKSAFIQIEVQWFEPIWGLRFWELWRRYLHVLSRVQREHPYAFVIFNGETRGRPLPIDTFYEAHTAAVYRAGLVPSAGSARLQSLGLTAHGHRHAYGHRAKNKAGLDTVVVQGMLHHASPDSQNTYTQLSREERLKLLKEASERMHVSDDWDGSLLSDAERSFRT